MLTAWARPAPKVLSQGLYRNMGLFFVYDILTHNPLAKSAVSASSGRCDPLRLSSLTACKMITLV